MGGNAPGQRIPGCWGRRRRQGSRESPVSRGGCFGRDCQIRGASVEYWPDPVDRSNIVNNRGGFSMNRKFLGLVLVTLFLSGCASGRNYNSEVSTLNARITSLQSQLEAKDREISALHDQVRSQIGRASCRERV